MSRTILSEAFNARRNVQRPSRKGVHSSEWKRGASFAEEAKDDDMVSSAWKHAAVERRVESSEFYRRLRLMVIPLRSILFMIMRH
jgi:hypothetical protein